MRRKQARRTRLITGLITTSLIALFVVIALPLLQRDPAPEDAVPTTVTTLGGTTEPSTLRLTAEADTTISISNDDPANGGSLALSVDGEPYAAALVRFTVPQLENPIASARLRLFPTSPIGSRLLVARTDDSWDEELTSYSLRPDRASPDLAESIGMIDDWVEIDVTPLTVSPGQISFSIEQSTSTLLRFSSREGDHPPELVLILDVGQNAPPTAIQPDIHLSIGFQQWVPSLADPDGDSLACWVQRSPQSGTATVAPDCSNISYTPVPGSFGEDNFDYTVFDGVNSLTVATRVIFESEIGVPFAYEGAVYVPSNTTRAVTLRGLDPDEQCPLGFDVIESSGAVTVSPPRDFECSRGSAAATVDVTVSGPANGEEFLVYRVTDSDELASASAVITLEPLLDSSPVVLLPSADGVWSQPLAGRVTFTRLQIDGEPERIAFVQFDLTQLNFDVSSAHLALYVDSSSFEGIEIHVADPNWTEESLRGGVVPNFSSSAFTRSGPVWDGEWIQIPIQRDKLAGDVLAIALTTPGSRAISIGSSESFTPPQLVLVPVQGPTQ